MTINKFLAPIDSETCIQVLAYNVMKNRISIFAGTSDEWFDSEDKYKYGDMYVQNCELIEDEECGSYLQITLDKNDIYA